MVKIMNVVCDVHDTIEFLLLLLFLSWGISPERYLEELVDSNMDGNCSHYETLITKVEDRQLSFPDVPMGRHVIYILSSRYTYVRLIWRHEQPNMQLVYCRYEGRGTHTFRADIGGASDMRPLCQVVMDVLFSLEMSSLCGWYCSWWNSSRVWPPCHPRESVCCPSDLKINFLFYLSYWGDSICCKKDPRTLHVLKQFW